MGMTYRPTLFPLFLAVATASCGATITDARVTPVARPADAIRLGVSSHVASAPAQVTVYTRVEPDSRTRSLTIEWWTADGVGGSHQMSVNGALDPARHTYAIKRLSEGEYVVSAILTRDDGSQVRRQTRVVVVGEGGRIDPAQLVPPTGDIGPLIPRSPW